MRIPALLRFSPFIWSTPSRSGLTVWNTQNKSNHHKSKQMNQILLTMFGYTTDFNNVTTYFHNSVNKILKEIKPTDSRKRDNSETVWKEHHVPSTLRQHQMLWTSTITNVPNRSLILYNSKPNLSYFSQHLPLVT